MSKTVVSWPTLTEVKSCVNVEDALRWNRFLPSPENDAQVEIIDAIIRRLGALRSRDDDAYVRASKNLGWD